MADSDAAGWHRFTQVTAFVPGGHALYRSSAPNYTFTDGSQDLTQSAVDFLLGQGIDSIISFNEHAYTPEEEARLARATPPIRYLHLKLGDFKPPTRAQFGHANAFFMHHKATLVHCGYGWGRTGTGVTALQIYAGRGATMQPLARTWVTPLAAGGNNVEKREQVSALCELRNLGLPRVTGIPTGDPEQTFAIIHFATGYYLTVSIDEGRVIAVSPEAVETTSTIAAEACQWTIAKDNQGDYTLSNKKDPTHVALLSQDAGIDGLVTYGARTQGNALFTINEVASGDKGRYTISPKPSSTLAIAIKTPNNNVRFFQSALMPVLLASNDSNDPFGHWILLATDFTRGSQA